MSFQVSSDYMYEVLSGRMYIKYCHRVRLSSGATKADVPNHYRWWNCRIRSSRPQSNQLIRRSDRRYSVVHLRRPKTILSLTTNYVLRFESGWRFPYPHYATRWLGARRACHWLCQCIHSTITRRKVCISLFKFTNTSDCLNESFLQDLSSQGTPVSASPPSSGDNSATASSCGISHSSKISLGILGALAILAVVAVAGVLASAYLFWRLKRISSAPKADKRPRPDIQEVRAYLAASPTSSATTTTDTRGKTNQRYFSHARTYASSTLASSHIAQTNPPDYSSSLSF